MRLIHVKLEKIRNKLFVKIPELIAEALHLKEGEEIEISIHSEPAFAQGELWGDDSEEVDEIDSGEEGEEAADTDDDSADGEE